MEQCLYRQFSAGTAYVLDDDLNSAVSTYTLLQQPHWSEPNLKF